jgi:hypothetical protein
VIVKVTRGGRMGGLVAYLAGPGRSNEHANARVVAGDPSVVAAAGDDLRARERVRAAALELDGPRVAHETAVLVKDRPAHVWHASLTLSAEEGALTDDQWQAISEQFVERMELSECKWATVRHGLSKAGNDHVHVVVNLVQEDGTPASTWNDYRRASRIVGELEREHGLRALEGRELGVSARAAHRAELERAQRLGKPEPVRDYLERVVRSSAQLAGGEAQFVQLLRDQGVKIRPRYAEGSQDIVGYSVAVPDGPWYGGGRLARDLTLPRLRQRWAAPGAQTADQAAHDAAGRLAAWSLRTERTPGALARESRELARFAQTRASAPGVVLGVAAALELRKRVRAAHREAELQEELDEQRERRRATERHRDRGIGI